MSATLSASPVRIGASRAGETDTRGLNFTNVLAPGDSLTLASLAVTIVRKDGVPVGGNDLTITPSGAVPPWLEASPTGIPGVVVAWWQKSGPAIAGTPAAPTPVDYQGTVSVTTTLGRTLVRDFAILVVPGLG